MRQMPLLSLRVDFSSRRPFDDICCRYAADTAPRHYLPALRQRHMLVRLRGVKVTF